MKDRTEGRSTSALLLELSTDMKKNILYRCFLGCYSLSLCPVRVKGRGFGGLVKEGWEQNLYKNRKQRWMTRPLHSSAGSPDVSLSSFRAWWKGKWKQEQLLPARLARCIVQSKKLLGTLGKEEANWGVGVSRKTRQSMSSKQRRDLPLDCSMFKPFCYCRRTA